MRSRTLWLVFTVSAALVVMIGAVIPAFAHGTPDQTLSGNPDCDATNFKGAVSGSVLLQEFTPSQPGLAGFDLCLNVTTAGATVNLNVREGTAAAPGATRASATKTVAATGNQWVHVDLPNVIPVTPATKLVIELPASASFQWRATCSAIAGSCTSVDSDTYSGGVASATGIQDFGFRSYSGTASATPADTADQKLTGDPVCSAATFRDFAQLASPQRQEFVPTSNSLTSIDLCVQNFGTSVPVTAAIRAGTLAAPGAVLQTKSALTSASGFAWVRITLDPNVSTTPGTTYLIEVPDSSAFQWRATCAAVNTNCTSVDTDQYPAGTSSKGGTADFGFRTFGTAIAGDPPQGTADQSLTGDPVCSETNFRGVENTGTLRQEFVPSAAGLMAVDLCIQAFGGTTTVSASIRPGTVAAPGAVIQTESNATTTTGAQWIRLIFDPIVSTTPGQKYVIEVPANGTFAWRATCGAISSTCTSLDADQYPAGISSRGATSDFAFRTLAGTATQGPADQKLSGDPACDATTLRAVGTGASPLRQEFVPTAGVRGLDSVDLCLNITTPGTPVTVNLRTGTAASPGPILGTATTSATVAGYQWAHLDFANAVPTLGGSKYVLEIPSAASFEWHGTCGAVGGACTTIDTDLYAQGVTNVAAVRDFGFRTIAGDPVLRFIVQVAKDGTN